MRAKSLGVRVVALAASLAALVALGGCASHPSVGPEPAGAATAVPLPTSSPIATGNFASNGTAGVSIGIDDPGIHDLGDGRVRVVGTFVASELEGGFVGVQLQRPWDSRSGTTVVIGNPSDVAGLSTAKLAGWTYVAVTGRLTDGVSIRMAGPEIEAESIEQVALPGPGK